MRDSEAISLLTRFEFSLRKITGIIEEGWRKQYKYEKVEEEKLRRLETIVEIYERIHEHRTQVGFTWQIRTFCSVTFGPTFQPKL